MFGHRVWRPAAAGLDLRADDLAELTELSHLIVAEYAVSSPTVLAATIQRLLQRRVPILRIEHSDSADDGYHLRFADGTALLVRGRHPGDVGWTASNALLNRVQLVGYACLAEEVTLDLVGGRRHVRLVAIGMDR